MDMEHAPIVLGDLPHHLRALAGYVTAPVVRMPGQDAVLAKQVLDAGAHTLMFPWVETVEQARHVAAATRYPPAGFRGLARMNRASRYTTIGDDFARANDEVFVIAQLETPQAIERLAAIGGVPGVDAVFLSPGDLAVNMGHAGNVAHAEVRGLMGKALERCRERGLCVGMVLPTAEQVRWALDAGCRFAAIASDMGFLLGGATAARKALLAP
jgi:2-keto-3-deoxy-L-rhamnonate aldolase RhmA